MLVLVTTHLLFLRSTQAAPVEGPAQLDSTTKPWDVASEYRTLFEILYSCLTTLTYCTWTAWHPNIPRQTDGKITKILQRVKMMFSVLMAPEMMALWATLQFIGARKLAKTPEFKAMGWGVSHGFFAQMGGFMLYSADGEPLNIIWPKDMVHMLNSVHIERPRLSKEEIDDRSKGDWIAKGLALIQTTYFLVQCVTRAAQRLPITELELITFAYTILNVYVYAMWWKKPQNVECAFPVYEKRLSAARRVLYERSAEAEEKSRSEESNQAAAYYANVNSNTPFYWRWLRRVAGFLLRLFVKPFFFAFQAWATPEEDKGIKATTMPPFYSYGLERTSSIRDLSFSALIAFIFGGIHCLSWFFPLNFPTRIEQIIWRVCCVATTAVPVLLLPCVVVANFYEKSFPKFVVFICYAVLGFPMIILYTLSRLALLIMPFVALRDLPSGVYIDTFANYIPHL